MEGTAMPLITSSTAQWVNVRQMASDASVAEGGAAIPAGTRLLIQNQGQARAFVKESATAPVPEDNTGRWVEIGDEVENKNTALEPFMRCSPGGVRAFVQVKS